MIRFVTLLAVPTIGSSRGAGAAFLPPPKPNFHLLAFFTTRGASFSTGGVTCEATATGPTDVDVDARRARLDARLAFLLRSITAPPVIDDERLAPRLARLISRAKLCEATARVSSVSSVVLFCPPFCCPPFRDPRFPRFLVERERPSSSCSLSASRCSRGSNVCALNTSSGTSASTPPTLGALLSDRLHMSGVRNPARDDGRREGGHEESGCPTVDEAVLRRRLCPLCVLSRSENSVGRSLIHAPNCLAVMGMWPVSNGGRTKTRCVRNSATGQVMPVKRCMKKWAPCVRKSENEEQTPSEVSVHGL
jgi:hypothetical protein